jgi:PAS domain S-box-containing protein
MPNKSKNNFTLEDRNNELMIELAQTKEKLKETKKKLEKIKLYYNASFTTSPDIIILIDLSDGKIVDINDSFEILTGYTKDETIGKTTIDLNLWKESEKRNIFLGNLEKEGKVFNYEADFIIKNGSIRSGLVSSKYIRIDDDIYNYSIIKDITEQKISEKELLIAKDKAEKSDKLKSEFLAQMSHEIRTPVNTILSFSSMLENELQDIIPDNIRFSFKMINNGGRRLIRTIELLLNVSELHMGSYLSQKKDVDLNEEILNPMINEFKNIAAEKGIELKYKFKNNEDFVYFGDQFTIVQLYLNIIDNAIKYTNKGNVSIELFKTANNKIQSVVEDTGIGMSEEFMQSLYDPFSQEESGYTRRYEGTGLGLSLAKKCCEINDITIQVESKKGKGTKILLNYA